MVNLKSNNHCEKNHAKNTPLSQWETNKKQTSRLMGETYFICVIIANPVIFDSNISRHKQSLEG